MSIHSARAIPLYLLSLLSLLAPLTACNHAQIHRRSGEVADAQIISSTQTDVTVRNKFGDIVQIPRDDIAHVDHPGRGLMLTGAIGTMFTAPYLLAGWVELRKDSPDYQTAALLVNTGTVNTITFAALFIWGAAQRSSSRSKYEQEEAPRRSSIKLSPTVLPEKSGKARAGAAISFEF